MADRNVRIATLIARAKRSSGTAAACICPCIFPLASWVADESATLRTAVDAAVRPLPAPHDVPGMAIALTVNGQSWFFGYGVASRAKKTRQ